MLRRYHRLLLAVPLGVSTLSGCCSWSRLSCYPPSTNYFAHSGSPSRALIPLPPQGPPGNGGREDYAPLTPRLNAPIPYDPGAGNVPMTPPVTPSEGAWGPPRDPQGPRISLQAPEPIPRDRRQERPIPNNPAVPANPTPLPGQTPEPPTDRARPAESPAPPTPGGTPAATPSPPPPTGIIGFSPVRDNVSTGRRPLLEGLDWLRERGYAAVLHIRAPSEADDSDRREFETKRNIRYLSLDVSPNSLTREIVDRFQSTVGDTANQPLFVYDRDGMLAGGLWYLHLRLTGGLSDAEARRKAAEFGLKEDENGPHREMWLAIQRYLTDNPIP